MKIYLVGGAVRDRLMGLTPRDQDWVIVGATTNDVNGLLAAGYTQVGADFPVFLHPTSGEEYALARVERKSGVGYHGFTVQADENVSIEDDLGRRDLTINSIAQAADGTVIDPYNGVRDLHNRILRHTTAAFAEDPLRVLRLARFAARFPDWKIADETMELCQQMTIAGDLQHLTRERVWVELEKGFSEADPCRFLDVLSSTGAMKGNELLNDLFGDEVNFQQKHIAKAISGMVPQSIRLIISIGLLARIQSKLEGASTRAKECHANFRSLVESSHDADSLLTLITKSRGFQEGSQFGDLVTAAMTAQVAGFQLPFTGRQLLTAQRIAAGVRASQFPDKEGKDLGAAIKSERIVQLKVGLDIPNCVV